MTKNTGLPTIDTIDNTDDQTQQMDTTPVISSVKAVIETGESGNSRRFVVYNHEGFDKAVDVSLTGLIQVQAGLKAAGKFAAGGFKGNFNFFLVAPEEKLAWEHGTGTMAYVGHGYQPGRDDLTLDFDGGKIIKTVNPLDIPKTKLEFQRLKLIEGELYHEANEVPVTPRDEDPWLFWYCYAAGALLSGYNLSLSLGPSTMELANQILAVYGATDRKAAWETHQYACRESARGNRFQKVQLEEITSSVPTGQPVVVSDEALLVKLANGGTISLKSFKPGQPIHRATAMGVGLSDAKLTEDSDAARLALANAFRERGHVIVIR